jgi:predicted PhzF superfamily epimerase YddE/YHI9
MRSFQASKRTGFMEVELKKDKVQIQGQAVIVFEGRLAI